MKRCVDRPAGRPALNAVMCGLPRPPIPIQPAARGSFNSTSNPPTPHTPYKNSNPFLPLLLVLLALPAAAHPSSNNNLRRQQQAQAQAAPREGAKTLLGTHTDRPARYVLPARYDQDGQRKYPVLMVLHGWGSSGKIREGVCVYWAALLCLCLCLWVWVWGMLAPPWIESTETRP